MQYPSIRIEGAILSSDIIDVIESGDKGFQKAKDFGLDPTSKVKDEIASTWADARDQWRIFARKVESLKEGATGTTETRNLWMSPLMGLLGYNIELAAKGEEVNGRNYAISHRDTKRGGFPIHVVGCNDSLDKRRAEGGKRMSPHALVQEYLNLTEHLYAVVSNGRLLRLLRDSTRLVKLSFLEFDLDRIFEEELFADFAILYRLLHASRMPLSQDSAAESVIEIYHQDALDSGSRIREGLSKAVEKSIGSLANGFLKHPANDALRDSIRSGQTNNKQFYQWQLRLIYRLLFLMVIEERDLIFAPNAERRFRDIYYNYYSIGRLRRLSEHRHFADSNFQDAWTGLRHSFQLCEDSGYGQKLGIAPLAGELFDRQAIGLLNDCRLDNEVLLNCLKNLSVFTNPITGQRMRVNYAALNVEEFGSVYEGLLEYDPRILDVDGRMEFSFVAGDDRASSGSHYTPDELVQPLPEKWWIFADKRPKLYATIRPMPRTLAINRHSKYPTFAFCPTNIVFSEATVIVAFDSDAAAAVLNSSLHEVWTWWRCSTMGSAGLRYTPSKGFNSFPFPLEFEERHTLAQSGKVHLELRSKLLLGLQLGLTEMYNLFHNPNLSPEVVAKASKQDADVAAEAYSGLLRLRELHREIDEAVLAAYGWHERSDDGPPIDLRHDFYEVDYLPENDRVRYTIHPEARRELLKRLLLLNHRRHAEEQSRAKEAKASSGNSPPKKRSPKKPKPASAGPTLFEKE